MIEHSTFYDKLQLQWQQGKFVCVGLDSEYSRLPESVRRPRGHRRDISQSILRFNAEIVDATKKYVCAYKPNTAFYEAHGELGLRTLRETIRHIHAVAAGVPVILDAKRADIGNTNKGYVHMAFDLLEADAITVHPYLGRESLEPFLERADKGIIVLCRTSNQGAGEFQDLVVDADPLYINVAKRVASGWNSNGNCALVVGATYPEELRRVRELVADMPILIPGVGAQGGDLERTVSAGKDSNDAGMIINSSRGIIFASSGADFAQAAYEETRRLHTLINEYRGRKEPKY
jgi:orotidine-5'-phosphate decarboxylase